MKPRPSQVACAWLCLVVFTLTGVFMPRGVVMCQDRHGARLELGCEKSGVGHCEESLVDADCGSEPCRDTPLGSELVMRSGDEQRVTLPAPGPAFTIPMVPAVAEHAGLHVTHVTCGAWMPPPAAPYLRSVVLLV